MTAETHYYTGSVSHTSEGTSDIFQAELILNGDAVTGSYVYDESKRTVQLKGQNSPTERLFLKATLDGVHWADIKLARHVTGQGHYEYVEGTVHWAGFLFEMSGQRNPVHLVETASREKHPAFLNYGYLPSVGYFLNISYNPETGKKIYNLMSNERVGPGLEGTDCIARGIPWLDCKLNYHPVDGCYLTEPQRKLCRQGPFDQLVAGVTGNCWSFEKGPGVQLPFQRAPESAFDLSRAEVIRAKSDTAAAQRVTATAQQVESRTNFLDRPVCESAFAWGPTCYDSDEGYECF